MVFPSGFKCQCPEEDSTETFKLYLTIIKRGSTWIDFGGVRQV